MLEYLDCRLRRRPAFGTNDGPLDYPRMYATSRHLVLRDYQRQLDHYIKLPTNSMEVMGLTKVKPWKNLPSRKTSTKCRAPLVRAEEHADRTSFELHQDGTLVYCGWVCIHKPNRNYKIFRLGLVEAVMTKTHLFGIDRQDRVWVCSKCLLAWRKADPDMIPWQAGT
jgi:hypothetical protein